MKFRRLDRFDDSIAVVTFVLESRVFERNRLKQPQILNAKQFFDLLTKLAEFAQRKRDEQDILHVFVLLGHRHSDGDESFAKNRDASKDRFMDGGRWLNDLHILHGFFFVFPIPGGGQVEQFLIEPQVFLHGGAQFVNLLFVLFAREQPGVLLAMRHDEQALISEPEVGFLKLLLKAAGFQLQFGWIDLVNLRIKLPDFVSAFLLSFGLGLFCLVLLRLPVELRDMEKRLAARTPACLAAVFFFDLNLMPVGTVDVEKTLEGNSIAFCPGLLLGVCLPA